MATTTSTRVAIATIVLLVVLGVAWYANFRSFLVQAVGMATCSFVFLWPQYKTERGVWMGGLLIMFLTAFMVFTGTVILFTHVPEAALESADSPIAVCLGVAMLASTFGFAAFASTVNYRRSRM